MTAAAVELGYDPRPLETTLGDTHAWWAERDFQLSTTVAPVWHVARRVGGIAVRHSE